jgi:PIN domain nuclease of toxin-antitoxin system
MAPVRVRVTPRWPPHHRDPFDRMLVAQAVAEGLKLASRDASIAQLSALT